MKINVTCVNQSTYKFLQKDHLYSLYNYGRTCQMNQLYTIHDPPHDHPHDPPHDHHWKLNLFHCLKEKKTRFFFLLGNVKIVKV